MSAEEIVWEEPPGPSPHDGKRRAREWEERLAPLRDWPERWARVYGPVTQNQALNAAANGRRGNWSGIDPDEWEITCRTVDGQGYVYARYLGGDQ